MGKKRCTIERDARLVKDFMENHITISELSMKYGITYDWVIYIIRNSGISVKEHSPSRVFSTLYKMKHEEEK